MPGVPKNTSSLPQGHNPPVIFDCLRGLRALLICYMTLESPTSSPILPLLPQAEYLRFFFGTLLGPPWLPGTFSMTPKPFHTLSPGHGTPLLTQSSHTSEISPHLQALALRLPPPPSSPHHLPLAQDSAHCVRCHRSLHLPASLSHACSLHGAPMCLAPAPFLLNRAPSASAFSGPPRCPHCPATAHPQGFVIVCLCLPP